MKRFVLKILIVILFCGCAGVDQGGSREVKFGDGPQNQKDRVITTAELQEDILRFTDNFLFRLLQANQETQKEVTPENVKILQRQYLLYASMAVQIATSPSPEINLMDMVTFITLNKAAVEEYWIPEHLHDKGKKILDAFKASEEEIWKIANKVSTTDQEETFKRIIAQWKRDNPGQYKVEGVRLTEVSKKAGVIQSKRSKDLQGLLSNIKGAVATADEALLLSNRAMFLAQRMPFLLRMQARIGTQDIVSDTLTQALSADEIMQEMQEFDPLINDISSLTTNARLTLSDLKSFIHVFRENFPRDPNSTIAQKFQQIQDILVKLTPIMNKLLSINLERGEKMVVSFREQVDQIILKTTLAFLVLIAAWWAGYYLVKRN